MLTEKNCGTVGGSSLVTRHSPLTTTDGFIKSAAIIHFAKLITHYSLLVNVTVTDITFAHCRFWPMLVWYSQYLGIPLHFVLRGNTS